MIRLLMLLAVLFATTICIGQKNTSKLDEQLTEMLQWFEGEFDNFQQVYKEKEDKVAEVHEHIHSIFKRINLPAFGSNTFYVLQYMDGDSTKIYRQRIYSFTTNTKENAIQLDIYSFIKDSLYYYAHNNTTKLDSLTPIQMTKTDGCQVYWKKDGEKYIGYMKKDACNFISKRNGKKIFITDRLVLTKNFITIRDEAYDENGAYVFGHKGKIPHHLIKCKNYKGWILLQKAGFDNDYIQMRNLQWHDQGSRVRLITEDGKPTKYEVELAAVLYGKNLEVLKIAIYEIGISKAVAYAWATPGSKNIGINMRWIQAGLTLIE